MGLSTDLIMSGSGLPKMHEAVWTDLGVVDYEKSMELQSALRADVAEGGPGRLLFLEHPHTITLGYSLKGDEGRSAIRSKPEALEKEGIKVVQVDRGGKATYHGPGQLVCYTVLSLKEMKLGVKRYVGKIESVVLSALKELGVDADLDPSYPGVWTGGAKVAAVGIRVSDRVSTHGFAINLDPDLAKFGHIVPCGIADKPVTSLARVMDEVPDWNKLVDLLVGHLKDEMRLVLNRVGPDDVWSVMDGG